MLTQNVNIDNPIKIQKSHTNVSNYENGILPLLIRIYRVPILKFHPDVHWKLFKGLGRVLVTGELGVEPESIVSEPESILGVMGGSP